MSDSPSAFRAEAIASIFRAYDRLALGAFRQVSPREKADGTTVTRVDLESSRLVTGVLRAHTPDYGILSEEETEPVLPGAEWRWVVDPLDGTASFARGYPVWGLGIGLLQGDRPREGYLRFPCLDESYTFAGGRLRLNGQAVEAPRAVAVQDTANLLVDSSLHKLLRSYETLREYKLRVFGSNLYHMASLALGRAEAMVCGSVYLWDLAAALPMTRAHGMVERHLDGGPLRLDELSPRHRIRQPLVIAPPDRAEWLLEALNRSM